MKRVRGYSLVEMVVVLTVGTAVTGMAVVILATVVHASRSVDDQVQRISTVRRLAEQFRADAHAAIGTEDGGNGKDGMLVRRFDLGAKRTAAYDFHGDAVERVLKGEETVVSRESYVLPKGVMASASAEGALVVLTIGPVPTSVLNGPAEALDGKEESTTSRVEEGVETPTSGTSLRIVAVVGKDHRFAKQE